jgi:hypothetical protein
MKNKRNFCESAFVVFPNQGESAPSHYFEAGSLHGTRVCRASPALDICPPA